MPSCRALAPDTGFIEDVLNFVDCQAQAIGASGYQALAAPGSTLSLILTALLTLFVAFIGYRMLFGQTPTLRDGVLALVKIGIVLALATSWDAYRTLVYDVALKGPADLARDIGRPAGIPGADGGLIPRLDNADRLLLALIEAGPGPGIPQRRVLPPTLTAEPAVSAPSSNPIAAQSVDALALGGARTLLLTGAAGALASLRLIAGVLLALGPFFFAFLLFDGTRGLFEGWLRVLAGTALGTLGTAIALGVELALIEPRLAYLLALRAAGYPIPGAAVELFVITLVFLLALLAMVIATARVTWGFRFSVAWNLVSERIAGRRQDARLTSSPERAPAEADRTRAAAVVDAVAAGQRRDAGSRQAALISDSAARRSAPHQAPSRDGRAAPPIPLGQSFRRTRNRFLASGARRDGRS